MASAAAQTYLTPEEYLAFERKATTKHEYLNGHIVAMSGASHEHNLITGDIFGGLYIQLMERECKVYASDMRLNKTKSNFPFRGYLKNRELRNKFSKARSLKGRAVSS